METLYVMLLQLKNGIPHAGLPRDTVPVEVQDRSGQSFECARRAAIKIFCSTHRCNEANARVLGIW